MGYRVFDPLTYKFSTEFELIFDESSARKRINSLYEHDARRALAKRASSIRCLFWPTTTLTMTVRSKLFAMFFISLAFFRGIN